MQLIFLDEAGTSGAEHENARIVASVLIDPDKHLFNAERLIKESLDGVPAEFRRDFLFHAEEIMNNRKYQDKWSLTSRLKLLTDMMSIPRKLGIPVSAGLCWNSETAGRIDKLSISESHHIFAFHYCIAKADQWIRDFGTANEIGLIIAEDHDMRKHLGLVPRILRENPLTLSPENLTWRQSDVDQGFNNQTASLRINRIRDTVHFVKKDQEILVWIADAIAYGLKRFFNQQKFGNIFSNAICGEQIILADFLKGPTSAMLFDFGRAAE